MNNKGYSFVEVMVVVLISTAVFAGIYSTFIVGNNAWVYYNDSVAVKKEVRRALFAMAKELREAENIKVIYSRDGSAIHFYRPEIGAVSYVWSKNGDNAGRIVRYGRAGVRNLAQYISSLTFETTKNALSIHVAATKKMGENETAQVILSEQVALRSKTVNFVQ